MAHFVHVAAVTFEGEGHTGKANAKDLILKETDDALASLSGLGLDLIVLSEGVGAVGQTVEDAEDPDRPGEFLSMYADFAASLRCHIAGGARTLRNGKVYNSTVFFGPGGELLGIYDKVHLTIGEIEEGIASGTDPVVVDTAVGRLAGVICFDLNFESLRNRYRSLKPDILVYASMFHGGLQQQTWAYDCRAYLVCAWQFLGGGILDPFGRPVALTHCYCKVATASINLDRANIHMDYNHEKFDDIRKKYGREVVIDVPGEIGSALLFSTTDKRSAMDVVREFQLELLDDYLARAAEANAQNR